MRRLLLVSLFVPLVAHADNTEEWKRGQLQELGQRIKEVAPDPGRERAPVRAPSWCGSFQAPQIEPGAIWRKIESISNGGDIIEAARFVCAYANEPAVVRAAAAVEQHWINLTGMSDRGAVYSLASRVDKAGFAAGKTKLCDALRVSDELRPGSEERDTMDARRKLFGCEASDGLWAERDDLEPSIIGYLDHSAGGEPDELVRLAWITTRTRLAGYAQNRDFEQLLVGYALDKIDYDALVDDKIIKALDTDPYRGNAYAQVIGRETLARVRVAIAALDVETYTAAAAKWREALARSNDFERAVFGPSKKAVAGCTAPLRKDFAAVLASLPHATANEAKDSLSDPIASLLLARVVACMSIDGDAMYAQPLAAVAASTRYARGPRFAAYYATLEAVAKIHEDRERFPVTAQALKNLVRRSRSLEELARDAAAKRTMHDAMGFAGQGGSGVIKKATKRADGSLQIAFVTEKHQEMSRSCTPSNRIFRIAENGVVEYYQNCKDTGLVWVDTTPDPVVIPEDFAGRIAAGNVLEFDATRGKGEERWAFPSAVYADKSKKKLVNYLGFGL
jgi:hypothetical protein